VKKPPPATAIASNAKTTPSSNYRRCVGYEQRRKNKREKYSQYFCILLSHLFDQRLSIPRRLVWFSTTMDLDRKGVGSRRLTFSAIKKSRRRPNWRTWLFAADGVLLCCVLQGGQVLRPDVGFLCPIVPISASMRIGFQGRLEPLLVC